MIKLERREDLTQEQVREWFHYNPATGDLTRLKKYDAWGNIHSVCLLIRGKNNRGYYWSKLFNQVFLGHRLIWLWMTGEHPKHEIDHINGVRTDNRWLNLRQVTSFENSRNQGVRKDCTCHVRGVNYNDRKNNRGNPYWCARISHKGVRYHLGNFEKFEDAVKARKQAEIDLGYHPNHAKRGSYRNED